MKISRPFTKGWSDSGTAFLILAEVARGFRKPVKQAGRAEAAFKSLVPRQGAGQAEAEDSGQSHPSLVCMLRE